MNRAFPFLVLLALASGGETPRMDASLDETGKGLRLRLEGVPDGIVCQARISREVGTLEPMTIPLKDLSVPPAEGGHAEVRIGLGEGLQVPGRYRVQVILGDAEDATVLEAALVDGTATRPYLEGALAEQAYLAGALAWTGEFLDRLAGLQAEIARDRAKGVSAWTSWRGQAMPRMESVLVHGAEAKNRFFPETYVRFSEQFLRKGLFQLEPRMFGAAENGGTYHAVWAFKGRTEAVTRNDLKDYERLFLAEAVWYRLAVSLALADEADRELRRKPDPERWARMRGKWDEVLGLWAKDLDPEAPETPLALPRRKELAALGGALRAWWDAADRPEGAGLRAEFLRQWGELKGMLPKAPEAKP